MTGDPTRKLLDADEVLSFIDDNTAVIDPKGAEDHSLVISSAPLRADSGEIAETSLGQETDSIEPVEPMVPVTLPEDVSDSVVLEGPDVAINFEGSKSSSPDAEVIAADGAGDNDLAFYPNAYLDADVAVAAISRGLESFIQIRSSRAPESYEMSKGSRV